jgi:hypothetical protein
MPAASGLPRETDIIRPVQLVRFVPTTDSIESASKLERQIDTVLGVSRFLASKSVKTWPELARSLLRSGHRWTQRETAFLSARL